MVNVLIAGQNLSSMKNSREKLLRNSQKVFGWCSWISQQVGATFEILMVTFLPTATSEGSVRARMDKVRRLCRTPWSVPTNNSLSQRKYFSVLNSVNYDEVTTQLFWWCFIIIVGVVAVFVVVVLVLVLLLEANIKWLVGWGCLKLFLFQMQLQYCRRVVAATIRQQLLFQAIITQS